MREAQLQARGPAGHPERRLGHGELQDERARADAERADLKPLEPAELGERLVGAPQHRARHREQHLAVRGRRDAPMRSLEEGDAQESLEEADALPERGLADPERRGCPPQRAQAAHSKDLLEMPDIQEHDAA